MKHAKSAFTMIELIFVIVILGVLAAVAIPKLAATRGDAEVSAKAHMVTTGATEIASFAMASGYTNTDFTTMSNSFVTLQKSADVVLTDNRAEVKVGDASKCVIVKIEAVGQDDILSIEFGDDEGDSSCLQIQSLINANDYPIKLRGQNVTY